MGPRPEIGSRKLDEVLAVNEFSKNQDCGASNELTNLCDGTQETRVRRLRTKHQEQFQLHSGSYPTAYTLTCSHASTSRIVFITFCTTRAWCIHTDITAGPVVNGGYG